MVKGENYDEKMFFFCLIRVTYFFLILYVVRRVKTLKPLGYWNCLILRARSPVHIMCNIFNKFCNCCDINRVKLYKYNFRPLKKQLIFEIQNESYCE